jgi:hypothetical protein
MTPPPEGRGEAALVEQVVALSAVTLSLTVAPAGVAGVAAASAALRGAVGAAAGAPGGAPVFIASLLDFASGEFLLVAAEDAVNGGGGNATVEDALVAAGLLAPGGAGAGARRALRTSGGGGRPARSRAARHQILRPCLRPRSPRWRLRRGFPRGPAPRRCPPPPSPWCS